MKDNPKVSVIIPAYNRENLIQRAIKSILNQSYKNIEVIVVDDGSTDNTMQKVHELQDERVRYYKIHNNSGVSAARNKGIQMSAGDIIAFQDSDDESYHDRIEKEVLLLINSSEDTGAVHCGREFYDSNTGEKIGQVLGATEFRRNFTEESNILTPSTSVLMIKKSVLDDVGYFDENMRAHVDTELAIRVSKKYKFGIVNEYLVKVYRYHEQIMGGIKNQVLAKEIIVRKHENYLSKKILYGFCKIIANYYILINDFKKARLYIKKSFRYNFEIKTLFQYVGIMFFPFLIKRIWKKKYAGGIPINSGIKPRE